MDGAHDASGLHSSQLTSESDNSQAMFPRTRRGERGAGGGRDGERATQRIKFAKDLLHRMQKNGTFSGST